MLSFGAFICIVNGHMRPTNSTIHLVTMEALRWV
jgi:hypothetical protein